MDGNDFDRYNIKHRSPLKLKNLIVKKFSFNRVNIVEKGSNIDVDFSHTLRNENNEISAELSCRLINVSFSLELTMEGRFVLDENTESPPIKLLEPNVLAIIFPFLRSQITLLTSQPDFEPLTLPAINITEWMNSLENQDCAEKSEIE